MALSAIVQNTESFKWNILDSCKCLNKVLFTPIIIASDTEGTRASKLRYSHFISSIMTESWRYIENHYQVWREEQPCHQPIWRLETLVTWWRVQCYPDLEAMFDDYGFLQLYNTREASPTTASHFVKRTFFQTFLSGLMLVWWSLCHLDISQHSNRGHGVDLSSFRRGEGNFKNDALEKVSWRIFIAAKRE